MDNANIKLHKLQLELLKKLTSNQGTRFNDLIIDGLESEHMNYHLKKLIELGLVIKDNDTYKLSNQGKDYCNLLDDQIEIVEKQPKTSVVLNVLRINPTTQAVEYLFNKRLRHPYFGKVGRLTGKVRFGERIEQAAARELYEETGLKAKTFVLEEVYHKMRHDDDGVYVQDVIFYDFYVTNTYGTFIPHTPYQENFWMSKHEIEQHPEFDLFDDLTISGLATPKKLSFVEEDKLAEGF